MGNNKSTAKQVSIILGSRNLMVSLHVQNQAAMHDKGNSLRPSPGKMCETHIFQKFF